MKIFIKIIDRKEKSTQTLCRDFVERSAKITKIKTNKSLLFCFEHFVDE